MFFYITIKVNALSTFQQSSGAFFRSRCLKKGCWHVKNKLPSKVVSKSKCIFNVDIASRRPGFSWYTLLSSRTFTYYLGVCQSVSGFHNRFYTTCLATQCYVLNISWTKHVFFVPEEINARPRREDNLQPIHRNKRGFNLCHIVA